MATKKRSNPRVKPTFEVRLSGPGVSPEFVSLSHINEALSAIQDLASGRDRYETSQVPPEKSIGLVDVSAGSAVYSCISRVPDEALSHLRNAAACLSGGDVEPDVLLAALPPIQSLSNVARLNECKVEVKWIRGRRRENLFAIEGDDYNRIAETLLIKGDSSVAGRLQRVGGATDTKCALRIEGRRTLLYCDVESTELARRLGKHLYEEIVVSGEAVWLHQSWRIYSFKVRDFSQPKLDDPDSMVEDLRASGLSAWDDVENPSEFVGEMRS